MLIDGLPWISLHPGMDLKNFWVISKQLLIVLHLYLFNDCCHFVWSFFPQLAYISPKCKAHALNYLVQLKDTPIAFSHNVAYDKILIHFYAFC